MRSLTRADRGQRLTREHKGSVVDPKPSADPLISLRREFHENPERSNEEKRTAERIRDFLATGADEVAEGLGGHGIAFLYRGERKGPAVLIRAELDALPIPEKTGIDHRSRNEGLSHKCGHDGHMAIAAGLGRRLAEERPERGSVTLLFQPAEETGEGARRVLDDPAFAPYRPDLAFGFHNLPGFPRGTVVVRGGVFAVASRGFVGRLTGATAHAAEPERGRSPALALAHGIEAIESLPQSIAPMSASVKATVIHARLGEIAFGTTPGEAVLMATLRAGSDVVMNELSEEAERRIRGIAAAYGLRAETEWTEEFPATENDEEAAAMIEEEANRLCMPVLRRGEPFPWSEDFGHFTAEGRGALFGLGAGEDHPALHHPDYDFPDDLVAPGVGIIEAVARRGAGGIERRGGG